MIPVQSQSRVLDFEHFHFFKSEDFTLRILLRQSLSCFKPLSCLKSGTHFYIDPAWFHALKSVTHFYIDPAWFHAHPVWSHAYFGHFHVI